MAYNEIITGLQVNTGWNLTFNPTGKFPVIAKRAFPTLADAQGYVDDPNSSATVGIVITVTQDVEKNNGIYLVSKVAGVDGASVGELIPAGSGNGSVTAENYSAAKGLATADNVGQLVYVLNDEESNSEYDEEGNKVVYSKGPYVVTGAGTVAKLGTTSASGDIAGDVEALKGDVATLQEEQVKGVVVDGTVQTVDDDKNVILDLSAYAKSADLTEPLQKLAEIEEKAQVNVIEKVKVAGQEVEVSDKVVSIAFDAVYDASTTSENAIQHKAIAAVIEDLRGKISEIPKFRIEVVDDLPAEGEIAVVYLKKETGEETNNLYEEYIWTGEVYELLGRQELDLTDYVTSGELKTELEPYAKTADVSTALEAYALKSEYLDASTVNGLLEGKVDKAEGYGLISDADVKTIGDNATAIAGLQAVDASLDERIGVLEANAIVAVSAEGLIVATTDENNAVGLSLTIGDCSSGKDGLATVADVNAYVSKSIENALTWINA